jgi:hypothetical protein
VPTFAGLTGQGVSLAALVGELSGDAPWQNPGSAGELRRPTSFRSNVRAVPGLGEKLGVYQRPEQRVAYIPIETP